MSAVTKHTQALRYKLPREYARLRIGVARDEAHAYNTTDRVLLTFDDFGTHETVLQVLQLLRQKKVKAAFFLLGNWTEKQPELVRTILAEGHWLGNHTYSHPHLGQLPDEEIRQEIKKGPQAKLLRPPYGDYNDNVRRIAAELGYKIAYWTIDSSDWQGHSAQKICDIILPRLHKGACILLHLNAPHMLEALPQLIEGIRAQGFELCFDGTEISW